MSASLADIKTPPRLHLADAGLQAAGLPGMQQTGNTGSVLPGMAR